jgi:hypothetical protein
VDVTPAFEEQMKSDLAKVDKMYNATGKDMTKFPEFIFTGEWHFAFADFQICPGLALCFETF